MFDGVLWVLKTGAQWGDLSDRFGPRKTVYGGSARWRDDVTLDRDGLIEWSAFCIDSATVRASRVAAGGRKGGAQPTGRLALVSRRITPWGARAVVL